MPVKKRRSISNTIDDYFEDLDEWAEQFDETLMHQPSWNVKTCAMEPLHDITVSAAEVVVTVDLPYTKRNTVQVKPLDNNSLEIVAKMRRKISLNELGITHHKGEIHKFHCHMRIPVSVNMEKMAVHYKKGLLELRVPRKRQEKARRE
jgi:HSP20 family molecular chaperone IbpA